MLQRRATDQVTSTSGVGQGRDSRTYQHSRHESCFSGFEITSPTQERDTYSVAGRQLDSDCLSQPQRRNLVQNPLRSGHSDLVMVSGHTDLSSCRAYNIIGLGASVPNGGHSLQQLV